MQVANYLGLHASDIIFLMELSDYAREDGCSIEHLQAKCDQLEKIMVHTNPDNKKTFMEIKKYKKIAR